MRFSLVLFIVIYVLITSCGTAHESNVSEENNEVETSEKDNSSKIVFLYFDIQNDNTNKVKISLRETQVVAGRLKENTVINAPKVEGNFIVQLLDNNQHVQEEQILQNPLERNMEVYIGEDEISTEAVSTEKGQFFIRFNRMETIKSVRIFKINSSEEVEIFNKSITI